MTRLWLVLLTFLPAHTHTNTSDNFLSDNQSKSHKNDVVSLHGTITNLRGKTYPISYLKIGGKQRCVRVYQGPCKTNKIIPRLCYDPRKYPSRLDLTLVKQITLPYPYATWFHQPEGRRFGKRKYLLLEVSWLDETQTVTAFLVDKKRRLSGTIAKKNRTSDCTIPLSNIECIDIDSTKI